MQHCIMTGSGHSYSISIHFEFLLIPNVFNRFERKSAFFFITFHFSHNISEISDSKAWLLLSGYTLTCHSVQQQCRVQ